jgi:hypothetical protein
VGVYVFGYLFPKLVVHKILPFESQFCCSDVVQNTKCPFPPFPSIHFFFLPFIIMSEAYEEHFVLPASSATSLDQVVIITNRSIMLVAAPGFAQLDRAAEVGASGIAGVPPGELVGVIRWDDVLAFEERWTKRDLRHGDMLVIHRRGLSGQQQQGVLALPLQCFPNTPQASQIKLVAQRVMKKYHLESARRDRAWGERHEVRRALPSGADPADLPLSVPCLDFVLSWHTNPARQPVVSFWKPMPPAGERCSILLICKALHCFFLIQSQE